MKVGYACTIMNWWIAFGCGAHSYMHPFNHQLVGRISTNLLPMALILHVSGQIQLQLDSYIHAQMKHTLQYIYKI